MQYPVWGVQKTLALPALRNTVVMEINPTPLIEPNQIFTSTTNGVTLIPKVSGDIVTWSWSPGDGLSGVDIANPIANPDSTTKYILTVVSRDGCMAKGEMIVKVFF
ncbi:MAG: hypothetical protein WDM78_15885 [Puia sp.]